jgi:hypothetical protein
LLAIAGDIDRTAHLPLQPRAAQKTIFRIVGAAAQGDGIARSEDRTIIQQMETSGLRRTTVKGAEVAMAVFNPSVVMT